MAIRRADGESPPLVRRGDSTQLSFAVVPTARRSRTIAAPAQELWELVRDPHHLPRWWPRVTRVEDVEDDAFTEVMRTRKGKLVRADFNVIVGGEGERTLTWVQRVEGTPFATVLKSAETELRLTPVAAASARAFGAVAGQAPGATADATRTEVTIELRQEMASGSARYSPFLAIAPRLGGRMVRRAAAATLDEALDGLERISG
jgi:uncharacterized protein YndB with AHSA1/START domain